MTANRKITRGFLVNKYGRAQADFDSAGFREMVNTLSTKELTILRKNEDLIERMRTICKYSLNQMMTHLSEHYGIKISYTTDDLDAWIYVDDDIQDLDPEWVIRKPRRTKGKTSFPYAGWYLSEEEMLDWGRDLVLQEVRVNLFLRYFIRKEERTQTPGTPCYGNYI
jgi:hypothetical protein